MGTEDWVLKGTKLITNTKKQRLKILSRGQILKNTVLKNKQKKQNKNKQKNKQTKKTYKSTEIIIYIYEVCFKNKFYFFCKVIVGYKKEN